MKKLPFTKYFKNIARRSDQDIPDASRRYSLAADTREERGRIIVEDSAPERRFMVRRLEVEDEDIVSLAFSSESPVMRWGEPEILCHSPDCVDLTRLDEVGAALFNHDPDSIVGTPQNIRIDADKVGRCDLRWGTTQMARDRRQEVADGSLRGVSVGYIVTQWMYFQEEGEFEGVSYQAGTWLATKWQALEVSLTPIAADASVGLGRTDVNNVRSNRTQTGDGRMKKKVKLLRMWMDAQKKRHEPGAIIEVNLRQFADIIDSKTGEEYLETRIEPGQPEPIPAIPAARTEPGQPEPIPAIPAARTEPPPAPALSSEEVAQRAVIADRIRARDIRAIGSLHSVDVTRHVDSGASVEQVRAAVLEEIGTRQNPGAMGTISLVVDGHDSFRDASVANIIARAGMSSLLTPEQRTLVNGNELRGFSMLRLAEESLRRSNVPIPGDSRELARLAFRGEEISGFMLRNNETISSSTSDFPYILGAVTNQMLLAGATAAPTNWREWASEMSANDFKDLHMISMSSETVLPPVEEGDDYTHSKRKDKEETMAVKARGRVFGITRQMIINDNLNAFTRIPMQQGAAAAMTPEVLAVSVLLANGLMEDGTALFAAGHNNLSGDASFALSTVDKARAGIGNLSRLIDVQTAYVHEDMADEVDLGIAGGLDVVLVPPSGYINAQAAVQATTFGEGVEGVNPLKGIKVVRNRYLEHSLITGNSAVKYYGFSDPMLNPVIAVAFLNGDSNPYFEEVDNKGSAADGRTFKVRIDCIAGKADWRGAIREDGA